MSSPGTIAIVAHDAGGAEILASYVAQNKGAYRFALAGPAINVFKRRLVGIDILSLEAAVSSCDWCLCGTGWQSDFEWRAIRLAHDSGKRVVSFLDHWVNYQERFVRNGVQYLPDKLWVGDEYAEKLARQNFSEIPIQLVPNPYFRDLKHQIAELEMQRGSLSNNQKKALFVCENISDHARLRYGDERYWGYTEFDAIEYFLDNVKLLGVGVDKVLLRPHPSDSLGKYDWVLNQYPGFVELSDGKPLIEEIVESELVVGCESMALIIGLLARKKVISCIPPGGPACRLPQIDVVHLRNIVDNPVSGLSL